MPNDKYAPLMAEVGGFWKAEEVARDHWAVVNAKDEVVGYPAEPRDKGLAQLMASAPRLMVRGLATKALVTACRGAADGRADPEALKATLKAALAAWDEVDRLTTVTPEG